jgi:hypothetical protein
LWFKIHFWGIVWNEIQSFAQGTCSLFVLKLIKNYRTRNWNLMTSRVTPSSKSSEWTMFWKWSSWVPQPSRKKNQWITLRVQKHQIQSEGLQIINILPNLKLCKWPFISTCDCKTQDFCHSVVWPWQERIVCLHSDDWLDLWDWTSVTPKIGQKKPKVSPLTSWVPEWGIG